MKYALLGVAALLLLIGLYCVYSGSGIIDVERGWASVIAGTTAVVGGALLAGLGFILHTLEQMRDMLAAEAPNSMAKSAFMPGQAGVSAPRPAVAGLRDLPGAQVAWPPHTSPLRAQANEDATAEDDAFAEHSYGEENFAEESFVQERFAPEAYAPGAARPEAYAETSFAQETFAQETFAQETFSQEPFGHDAFDHADFAAPMAERAGAGFERPSMPDAAKSSPSIRDLWRRVGKEAESKSFLGRTPMPKSPVAEPTFTEPPADPAGAKDDWLDHALAELDSAIAHDRFSHPGPAHTPVEEEAEHEALEEEAFAPPLAAEPEEAHVGSGEEPTVIGRYEAEGTSYIMFSDGSIEAQSERGVARFNSMAELKAYFETQDAPQ